MSDTALEKFLHYGTEAQRLAFTPNPAAGVNQLYEWYATDTGNTYIYDTSWHLISGSSSASASATADHTLLGGI